MEAMLASLLLLLAGVLLTRAKVRYGHLVRGAGWLAFGLYWLPWGPYFAAMPDYINALATFGALPVMLFLAYHEYLCHRWKEEYEPLRFASVATCVAGLGFYIVYTMQAVAQALIYAVASNTVWILNRITPGYSIGPGGINGDGEYSIPILFNAPHVGSNVDIVIACTAIQAILVAAAFILTVDAPMRRRLKTFLVVAIPTYFLNLLRNIFIVYFVYNGITDFETAHAIIGKIAISLVGFFALMLLAFTMLPELYISINGLFDLPWRKKPGHDYKEHIGRVVDALFPRRT
jgi:archaeosortase A (PGF-CTERM-specific)